MKDDRALQALCRQLFFTFQTGPLVVYNFIGLRRGIAPSLPGENEDTATRGLRIVFSRRVERPIGDKICACL